MKHRSKTPLQDLPQNISKIKTADNPPLVPGTNVEGIFKKSLLAKVSTKTPLKDFRKFLEERGYAFGFFAGKEAESCTLKNILENRITNLWHLRYGTIEDLCTSLIVETPLGHIRTKLVPRSATGPDLKKVFIGSHHHYGDIEQAVLQIMHPPELRKTVTLKISGSKNAFNFHNLKQKIWASGIRPLTMLAEKNNLVIELEGLKDIVLAEEKLLKKLRMI